MLLLNNHRFSSLKHKNFKYFMLGQTISLVGTMMQKTALAWLLYSLTKSPFLLGLLGVFQFGPVLLFSVFFGALVDRFPKKRLLYLTQTISMLEALILTILVYSNVINYWHIFILATILGLVQTIDMPVRQSFFIELVGKNDLTNAISLHSTITNLARIIAPAIAGAIILKFSMSLCFLINFISYIPVFIGLFLISLNTQVTYRSEKNIIEEIKDGFTYIRCSNVLSGTVFIMAMVCTFAMNVDVIIPVFSKTILHKDADGYSLLLCFMGIGSFIGAFTMAGKRKEDITLNLLKFNAFLTAILQITASFTSNFFLCAILIMGAGFANMTFLNASNSLLQLNTSNEYRGRVMSFHSLLNLGTTPIGNIFVGVAMEKLGPSSGFFFSGLLTGFLTVVFSLSYMKKLSDIKST